MLETIFLVIFLGAAGVACATVWRKIPLLLQVPPQLIEESFVTRPSRLTRFLEPVEAFFHERRYRELYYLFLVRFLHRVRLWLLRLERGTFRMSEALQARGRRWEETERYWSELKLWKRAAKQNGASLPPDVLEPQSPPAIESKGSPSDSGTPA